MPSGCRGSTSGLPGTAPQTDLQHELELIRGKSRPHTPKRWVSMLEGRAEMQRVYEGMAARGIVEHVGEKHLGVFRSVRYPEKDHAPEAALLEKIQAALGVAPPPESGPAGCRVEPMPRRLMPRRPMPGHLPRGRPHPRRLTPRPPMPGPKR